MESKSGKDLSIPALLLADESVTTSDIQSNELGWVQFLSLCLPAIAVTFAATIYVSIM